MRLIDADEAVKKVRAKADALIRDIKTLEAKQCKNEDEEQRKQKVIERKQKEATDMVEFIAFLVYECKEVKVNTKEKE